MRTLVLRGEDTSSVHGVHALPTGAVRFGPSYKCKQHLGSLKILKTTDIQTLCCQCLHQHRQILRFLAANHRAGCMIYFLFTPPLLRHCRWTVMMCIFRCVYIDGEYFRNSALILFVSKTLFPMFPVQFFSPSTATCRPSRTPAPHIMLCWRRHLKFIRTKLIRMTKFILFWLFFWEKWRWGSWVSVKSSSAQHESKIGADFELWEHKQSWELNLITELNFCYCAGSFIRHFFFFPFKSSELIASDK